MTLKAEKICKTYGTQKLLNNISLTIQPKESIAICGRSGEGKTTLLHILGALEQADSGQVWIANQPFTKKNAPLIRNQQIGFIFQSYNLLEDFTALENVLMPARIAREAAPREKGIRLLSLVGLEKKADTPAKLLSGGERQRIAVARAVCNDPELILADEPTGNLDRENGQKVVRLLLALSKSLILVTHDPEIAALCDRKYLLRSGHLELIC